MARQKGVMKVEGTIDDLTYYKTKDGYLVKRKSGVSKTRIDNDPNFARTRENDAEFKNAAISGKYLRDTMRTLMNNARDGRVTSRLMKLMSTILRMDPTSARGERTVGTAIALPAAKALLKGFEFNAKSPMGSVLFTPYSVTTATGVIVITDLIPVNDVAVPEGATHLTLRGAYANVNFADGVCAIEYTNAENLPIDTTLSTVTLTPSGVPAGTGTKIYVLEIEFFQEVNGVQYELNNDGFNSLVITEVV
jgi:hypothetical protein